MGLAVPIGFSVALAIALIAAAWDWRKGEIPNWLTFTPILGAPIVYGLVFGPMAALRSVAALLLCGVVPFILFKQRAMGGGDVKLFAALGAVTGGIDVMSGVEIQFAAFIVAMVITLAALAWNGKLFRTLGNALYVAFNPILPAKWKRDVSPELMTTMRMGGPILIATGIILVPTLSKFVLLP